MASFSASTSPFLIRSLSRGVSINISRAATLLPSTDGISRCEIIARRLSESEHAASEVQGLQWALDKSYAQLRERAQAEWQRRNGGDGGAEQRREEVLHEAGVDAAPLRRRFDVHDGEANRQERAFGEAHDDAREQQQHERAG